MENSWKRSNQRSWAGSDVALAQVHSSMVFLFKSHFQLLQHRNYCGHLIIEKIGAHKACFSKVAYLHILAEVRFNPRSVRKWITFISIAVCTEDWAWTLIRVLNFRTVTCSFVELWLILFPQNRVAKNAFLSNTEDEQDIS